MLLSPFKLVIQRNIFLKPFPISRAHRSSAVKTMGMLYRRVCLLLIIGMCGLEGAYTYTNECKATICGWFDKPQISCQWNQGDKSVMCKGMHLRNVPSDLPHSVVEFVCLFVCLFILFPLFHINTKKHHTNI